jgi:RND superfamily putative drug exporter
LGTSAVRDVVRRLERIEGITEIESPLDPATRVNTVSKDGRSVVVNFKMPGSDEHVEKLVDQPLAAVAAIQAAHPGVRVEQFGDVSATKEIAAQDTKDGQKAHFISYGLMLIILLVAFGAVVAAGLPLVLGATAVAGTVGLLGPVSQLYALPADVAELVVIIGLAVAAAILIDATIIRAVLLPASMKLLGARNWYLPRSLGWLPKFEREPQATPAPA